MTGLAIDILVWALCLAGTFMTLSGLVFWVHIMRSNRPPMDRSNRIAHLRLVWFALTRPEIFAGLVLPGGYDGPYNEPAFPWLGRDELDNTERGK